MKLFQSKLAKIALAYSVVCVFFHLVESGSSRKSLAEPLKKLKMTVLCLLLKLALIFQLDIQDVCQIQYNFKTLQEANKFVENYEIKTFSELSVFQKDAGFKTKVWVILDCLSFCKMLFSQKLKVTAEKQYIITDGIR